MIPALTNSFNHYKNLILKKQVTYLIILFSSLFIISTLWINKIDKNNLNVSLDEVIIIYIIIINLLILKLIIFIKKNFFFNIKINNIYKKIFFILM